MARSAGGTARNGTRRRRPSLPRSVPTPIPANSNTPGPPAAFIDFWAIRSAAGESSTRSSPTGGNTTPRAKCFGRRGVLMLVRSGEVFRRLGGFDGDFFAHGGDRLLLAGATGRIPDPGRTAQHGVPCRRRNVAEQQSAENLLNFRNNLCMLFKESVAQHFLAGTVLPDGTGRYGDARVPRWGATPTSLKGIPGPHRFSQAANRCTKKNVRSTAPRRARTVSCATASSYCTLRLPHFRQSHAVDHAYSQVNFLPEIRLLPMRQPLKRFRSEIVETANHRATPSGRASTAGSRPESIATILSGAGPPGGFDPRNASSTTTQRDGASPIEPLSGKCRDSSLPGGVPSS